MLIKKIFIRGAIGIQKGLGLEEIEIDFENKTGLIALSGPNGRGKTTILELMSPYRTFASRKGALNHHFFLRDSRVERWFEFNGVQYHTINKIDSGSERAESFIEADGVSMVNGKNKEYDSYIQDIFGSEVLFYNSVFCAQGSKSFADMRTGEIKELFIEFLRLDRLAEHEAQSKRAVNFYAGKLSIAETELGRLANIIQGFEGKKERLVELNDSNIRIEGSIKIDDDSIESAQAELVGFQKIKTLNKVNSDKIEELNGQFDSLKIEIDQLKKDLDLAEYNHADAFLEITTQRKELRGILNDREAIEKASSMLGPAKERERHFADCLDCVLTELNDRDRDTKEIQATDIDPLFETKKALGTDDELYKLTKEIAAHEVGLRKAKERDTFLLVEKRQLENDPYHAGIIKDLEICRNNISLSVSPKCKIEDCPARDIVKNAIEELPGLEHSLEESQDRLSIQIKKVEADLKAAEASILKYKELIEVSSKSKADRENSVKKEIDLVDKKLKVHQDKIYNLTSESLKIDDFKAFYRDSRDKSRSFVESLEVLASKAHELLIADSEKQALDKSELKIVDAFGKDKNSFSEKILQKRQEIDVLNKKTLEIDEKINTGIDFDIKKCERFIQEMLQEKKELLEMISKNDKEISIINHEMERKIKARVALNIQNKFIVKLKNEISEWTYLKISCSKTGLQALEIDGAAPLITREANLLLEMTFGLDFQIKIETQDPETGKEIFRVLVIRGDGSEDRFDLLSGGQKVWIAKALSLGMTLVSKHKSEKAFLTLFADEADGPLDKEKRLDFIGFYRSMMAAGSFQSCMYISHDPDAVAMADNTLDFSGDSLVWR